MLARAIAPSLARSLARSLVLLAPLLAAAEGASAAPGAASPLEPRWRVLFVGNSLTAANDVPATVAHLSRADFGGSTALAVGSILVSNASLEDHLEQGDVANALAEQPWNAVVLQQGPSALPESRVQLVASTRRVAALTAPREIPLALYAPWPSERRRFDFDAVADSYRAAAAAVGGTLLPVGEAWRAAWREDRRVELYGPDRFHPSPVGSHLAALVIYGGLTGRPLAGLTARLGPETPRELRDRPELQQLLEAAATTALAARPAEVAAAPLRP